MAGCVQILSFNSALCGSSNSTYCFLHLIQAIFVEEHKEKETILSSIELILSDDVFEPGIYYKYFDLFSQ